MARSEVLQNNSESWMPDGLKKVLRTSLRWGAFGVGGVIALAVVL